MSGAGRLAGASLVSVPGSKDRERREPLLRLAADRIRPRIAVRCQRSVQLRAGEMRRRHGSWRCRFSRSYFARTKTETEQAAPLFLLRWNLRRTLRRREL